MLSFAAEFPVKASQADALSDCVASWLKGSPHREFTDDEIDSLRGKSAAKIERSNQSLEVIAVNDGSRDARGCRHTALDEGVLWTTTVVCSVGVDGAWVGIRTERVSINPQIHLTPAKKPHLVRTVLKNMGGGLDGEIFVQEAPHFLQENDLNMAVRLMNGDSENYLPVVYVSRGFRGDVPVNVDSLSRALGGLAHVLVEPSRDFSRQVQRGTGSRNAYGGALGIYLPTGQRSLVMVDGAQEQDVRFQVSGKVRDALVGRRPLPQCTWASLEAERSRNEIRRLREQNSTDIDAYTQAFDTENSALRTELTAANEEIARLKSDVYRLSQSQSSSGNHQLGVKTQDYFDGESDHFIREALEGAIMNVRSGSRRQQVLSEFLQNFSKSPELERRKAELKAALRDARGLSGDTAKILSELGFSIDSSGKHHKLVYNGDESLTFTMPKTSSDWRAGMNMNSDISNMIY